MNSLEGSINVRTFQNSSQQYDLCFETSPEGPEFEGGDTCYHHGPQRAYIRGLTHVNFQSRSKFKDRADACTLVLSTLFLDRLGGTSWLLSCLWVVAPLSCIF